MILLLVYCVIFVGFVEEGRVSREEGMRIGTRMFSGV